MKIKLNLPEKRDNKEFFTKIKSVIIENSCQTISTFCSRANNIYEVEITGCLENLMVVRLSL